MLLRDERNAKCQGMYDIGLWLEQILIPRQSLLWNPVSSGLLLWNPVSSGLLECRE